jgi:hypothetical protein
VTNTPKTIAASSPSPYALKPPRRGKTLTSSGNQSKCRLRHQEGELKPASHHQPNHVSSTMARTAASSWKTLVTVCGVRVGMAALQTNTRTNKDKETSRAG